MSARSSLMAPLPKAIWVGLWRLKLFIENSFWNKRHASGMNH
ncbi:hypothetical protein BN128_2541 [Cronobacter sakazakii 696]|nr:hypothetical protein BN128_2541 [Cronobacter sakazakii 696]